MNPGIEPRRWRSAAALPVAAALLLPSFSADAASTLISSSRNFSNSLFVSDSEGNTVFLDGNSTTVSDTGNIREFLGAAFAPDGTSVTASFGSNQISGYLPEATPIGGPFEGVWIEGARAWADGEQTSGDHNTMIVGATAFFATFSLDAPMRWAWSADAITGSTSGDGSSQFWFGIYDGDVGGFEVFFERRLSGDFDLSDSASGVLPAGNYQLLIQLITSIELDFVPGSGEHSVSLGNASFTLAPIPAPGALVLFASAAGGLLGAARAGRQGLNSRSNTSMLPNWCRRDTLSV